MGQHLGREKHKGQLIMLFTLVFPIYLTIGRTVDDLYFRDPENIVNSYTVFRVYNRTEGGRGRRTNIHDIFCKYLGIQRI